GADAGEGAAAAGTIIIGSNDELLGGVDWLAVVHQVDDAVGFRVRLFLAVGGIFGRLGDVDLVGDTVEHVVIIGGKVRIDQRGVLGTFFDLIENASRTFEPVLHI